MLPLCQPEQIDAQQWPLGQVKRLCSFCIDAFPGALLAFGLRQMRAVFHRQLHRYAGSDHLAGAALDSRKRASQRLVAIHQLLKALLQDGNIERPGETQRVRQVICSALRRDLMHQPERFLGKG